ncbi:hypothetical protein BCV69DRAFT_285834 [Microstroma glucosiphilum]|uniref:Fungal-type protein kinase domain-containing protein n=1 Tax=Pseudomicrostroma glucosiphilum TaxID=1684307 RepID=A0A316TVV7_9BASI|nr:hypothetical protein BCV69DRAFT_285834 [Pseudomicrostroma glucosiphilum]PWN17669.1 hypothetical protein BCV69DRAFT_285834 [Pseudomicrostroma glucosiphilum]
MATAGPGQAGAAVGSFAPPYTLLFPPAPPNAFSEKPTLIAATLQGCSPPTESQSHSDSSEPMRTISGSPPTFAALTSRRALAQRIRQIEAALLKDGTGRCFPTFYTMNTSPEVDRSAREILASEQVTNIFGSLNAAVKDKGLEKDLVRHICDLGAAVRSQLQPSRPQSHYGTFVRMENVRMDNDAADPEVNKVDIFVRGSNPSADANVNHWSNVVAFIEVKRTTGGDLTEQTALQCLRYARKMCHYRPVTSHIHFMTWCGSLVRLWYLDAVIFGCSEALDTHERSDRIEIVKILRLLCLEDHCALLTGYWDLAAQSQLKIEANEAADIKAHTIHVPVQSLYIRPGPFRTRTAIFASAVDGVMRERVIIVKASWVAFHLVAHELMILVAIQKDPVMRQGLPLAPVPVGLAEIPADFQRMTSDRLTPGSASAFPARAMCALVTRQHLGDPIGKYTSSRRLANLHKQFAEQLLVLARGEIHYRDINDGNMRVLRGDEDTLLIIDLGNARMGLCPRGQPRLPEAEATIKAAADDTRSGTPEFLPVCITKVAAAVQSWNEAMKSLSERILFLRKDAGRDAGSFAEKSRRAIIKSLPTLHKTLREAAVHSHRFIDDLESATYLHLWQTARRSDESHARIWTESMSEKLLKQNVKLSLWENWESMDTTMNDLCKDTGRKWRKTMLALQKTIRGAQKQVRKEIGLHFTREVTLETLKTRVQALEASSFSCEVQDIVNRLLQTENGLVPNKVLPTEVKCFETCIQLLKDAAEQTEDGDAQMESEDEQMEDEVEVIEDEGEETEDEVEEIGDEDEQMEDEDEQMEDELEQMKEVGAEQKMRAPMRGSQQTRRWRKRRYGRDVDEGSRLDDDVSGPPEAGLTIGPQKLSPDK